MRIRQKLELFLVIATSLVIICAPLLLLISFERYIGFVVFIWAIVALFYVLTHRKKK